MPPTTTTAITTPTIMNRRLFDDEEGAMVELGVDVAVEDELGVEVGVEEEPLKESDKNETSFEPLSTMKTSPLPES